MAKDSGVGFHWRALVALVASFSLSACGDGLEPTAPSEQPEAKVARTVKPLAVGDVEDVVVSKPFVERFQLAATDGEGSQDTSLSNHWGGNQGRVTAHSDGTVRVLYLRTNTSTAGPIEWRVMKLEPGKSWTRERAGFSNDDASLVRDPVTDMAHVLAWPNGVPSLHSLPGIASQTIPGIWPFRQAPRGRGYGGAGIGDDGTFCMKVSREDQVTPPTSQAYTDFICGKYNSAKASWEWQPQVRKYIGLRHAYDYVFPGAGGNTGQFLATSEPNLHKDAAAMPWSGDTYIFNGVRFYSTATGSDSTWRQLNLVQPLPIPPKDVSTRPPYERPVDSFVDSRRRIFSAYFVDDPLKKVPRGLYLAVSDTLGKVLYKGQLAVPTYGKVRIFEDGKGRLWVMWSAPRPTLSSLWLYLLNETSASGSPDFRVSTSPTVLDSAIYPYAIEGAPFVAVPRVGSKISNAVEALMVACDGRYQAGAALSCYPSGTTNRQRLFRMRIRLPD